MACPIPPQHRLYFRTCSLAPVTEECAHVQLWNKGTLPIILWHWSATSVNGTNFAAGTTGSGNPLEGEPPGPSFDALRMRLCYPINEIPGLGYSYANGVHGCAGDPSGLASGPPSVFSQHGELRAQISTNAWQLSQAYVGHVWRTTLPVDAHRGLVITPGHGWTVRASQPRADLAVSFVWAEPYQ